MKFNFLSKIYLKIIAWYNYQLGKRFLTKNSKKPGIITLKSGLQYKPLQEGIGQIPNYDDLIVVNYEGRFINGKIFDSSFSSERPSTFKLSKVIVGWVEALQLMKEGATYELYIPSGLAYRQKGSRGIIGPNETLIFKVHLIKILSNNPIIVP